MNGSHFDAFVRAMSGGSTTRRTLSRGLAGGALAAALTAFDRQAGDAKKRCGPCKKRKQGKCKGNKPNGTACPGGACQGGSCVTGQAACVPEPQAVTCARVCGTRTNNCGQTVVCSCPDGECLANGTCAQLCVGTGNCPSGCACSTQTDEGTRHCVDASLTCATLTQSCASTAECPLGQNCRTTFCGANGARAKRCVPLCPR